MIAPKKSFYINSKDVNGHANPDKFEPLPIGYEPHLLIKILRTESAQAQETFLDELNR